MRRRWQRAMDHEDYAKAIEESKRVMESENLGHTYGIETCPPEDPGPEPPRVSDVGGGSQR